MMKKTIFYSVLFLMMTIPSLAHGADFYFERSTKNSSSGENQLVLKLKTGRDNVNAVSGKIEIPTGVEVSKINTGSSVVLIWLDQPRPAKTVVFSGITPGGFQGDVTLFTLSYSTKLKGDDVLKVTEGEVIRNDGSGSLIVNTSKPFSFALPYTQSTSTEDKDTVAPEIFTIALGQESMSFDGSYFASFAAQDKKSGVEKYEWAHTMFFEPGMTDWQQTVSPVVLSKAVYFQKIFIKATDGEGNSRVVLVDGPYRYTLLWIGIILVLTVLCVLFFVRPSLYRSS
ncbi:MAG: hypothetical protein RLZZ67_576 [Candidatus Parcubacteria bacterium]|jgi:hypothetical protein